MFRVVILLLACALAAQAQTMSLKDDQRIIFYPAVAERISDNDAWRVEIHGTVFEPEKRTASLWLFRRAMGLDGIQLSAAEQAIFNARARLFLVDHERGKRVVVRVGSKTFRIGKSRADGSFDGTITISGDELRENPIRFLFNAALPSGDGRDFRGEAFTLEETGVSVISDIDDTIKITEVRDRRATLRNTFLRDFEPVAGMVEFYQRLARERGAQFHYVSASPWQLYEPLSDFVRSNGFPAGTFSLKKFRWKDRSLFSLFADPEKYKKSVIEPLLKRFPKRRFILVGDSGERDPEIYGALARKFSEQIGHIYIRDATGESADADRYGKAFRELRRNLWTIFREPEELLSSTRR